MQKIVGASMQPGFVPLHACALVNVYCRHKFATHLASRQTCANREGSFSLPLVHVRKQEGTASAATGFL